eukprot:4613446-Amphidinium_carterae.1
MYIYVFPPSVKRPSRTTEHPRQAARPHGGGRWERGYELTSAAQRSARQHLIATFAKLPRL